MTPPSTPSPATRRWRGGGRAAPTDASVSTPTDVAPAPHPKSGGSFRVILIGAIAVAIILMLAMQLV